MIGHQGSHGWIGPMDEKRKKCKEEIMTQFRYLRSPTDLTGWEIKQKKRIKKQYS